MEIAHAIATNGYALATQVLEESAIDRLIQAIELLERESAAIKRRGESRATYAIRNLFAEIPDVRAIALSSVCVSLASQAIGEPARAIRGTLFDKTPEANWKVRWHQDCTIPLCEKIETPGFTGWSVKAGTVHAEAPAHILEQMVALRIHLDDCGETNGPLKVFAGTHRAGVLERERVVELASAGKPEILTAQRGDILLMKPLLLHSSAPAESPAHRRVIHLDYAACELPNGLRWPEV